MRQAELLLSSLESSARGSNCNYNKQTWAAVTIMGLA